MNKNNVEGFINKGIEITKNSINRIKWLNFGFAFISTILFLMITDYVNLTISTSIYILNLAVMRLIKTKKYWSYENAFLAYAIGMFNFCICINFIIYGALTSINAFSCIIFVSLIVIQAILFMFFLIFNLCTVKFYKKKHVATPFVSSGVGYIAYFILKHYVDIPQEYASLMINLIFYTLICFVIYELCNILTKYILVKKYNINYDSKKNDATESTDY